MLIDEKQVLIIITYGRSGSTLLQAILNSVEDIHISGENGGIINKLFYTYKHLKLIKNKPGRLAKSKEPNQPWFNLDKINLKKFRRKILNVFFSEVVNPPKECNIIGFKEIRFFESPEEFLNILDFIIESIPTCKFVFNSRNHEDVRKSGWWKEKPKDKVLLRLSNYEKLMKLAIDKYPERSLWVKYDDYINNLEHLKDLFEFLDCDLDEEKLRNILNHKLIH